MEQDDKLSLSSPIEDFEEKILKEENQEELKNIINLFNLNIKKKDILRAGKLNELQDKTLNQITSRIENNPDMFSNKDLLEYYKVIQETLNKSNVNIDNLPTIQINQNIVNMNNESSLSRDSRQRVIDVVEAILKKAENNDIIDVDVDKESGSSNNE